MKIVLFTSSFPFGNGETFVENELSVISKYAEHVYLIPMNTYGSPRILDSSLNVTLINLESFETKTENGLLSALEKIIILLKEWKSGNTSIKNLRYDLRILRNAEFRSSQLLNWIGHIQKSEFVFYSYWFDEWATVLAILKMKNYINSFISRAHGYDLYFERHSRKQIPMRNFQIKYVDYVYPVSKNGYDYLTSKFSQYKSKFDLSHLGTVDSGIGTEPKSNLIHVVSCSAVKKVKRVEIIFDYVENTPGVYWTHLGGGDDFDELKSKVNNSSCKSRVTLKGNMSNVEVIEFLKKNSITCLINVSSSEGLPVSIMEAISFGIPVVATNVGGTSEIVNNKTGILLPSSPHRIEIQQGVKEIIQRVHEGSLNPKSIREFWMRHFNAEVAYKSFLAKVLTT